MKYSGLYDVLMVVSLITVPSHNSHYTKHYTRLRARLSCSLAGRIFAGRF